MMRAMHALGEPAVAATRQTVSDMHKQLLERMGEQKCRLFVALIMHCLSELQNAQS